MAKDVIKLMRQCWDDDERIRLSFSEVDSYIKKNIQKGK